MDEVKIRKAKREDIKQMIDIMRANGSKYSETLAKKELMEMFSKSLVRPTYILLEAKNKILGFGGSAFSWSDNMIYDLFWINVHPDLQGKGIGKKIVEFLIMEIKKMKKPRAKMITLSTKIPSFYEKFGFRKITPKYDGDYVLMKMILE